MEIRIPNKSKGVPRQYEDGSLPSEIKDTFKGTIFSSQINSIFNSMTTEHFWDSSLSAQWSLLANILYDIDGSKPEMIKILKSSNSEYMREIAAP